MIISDNHKKTTIIIPFSNSFQKNLGSNWQMVREKNACSFSHQPALPSRSKDCRVPSRAGDSINIKNLHFNSRWRTDPHGLAAIINQILKLYKNIVVDKWRVELHVCPPTGRFRYTSYLLPLLWPRSECGVANSSYILHLHSTAITGSLLGCLFSVLG